MAMTTINFYSYKGGVGRTMLTSQIARLLAALGKRVVVADFDFDAPGIPAVFGMRFQDIDGGLFELYTKFQNSSDDEFKVNLDKYLKDVDIKLRGEGNNKTGCIKILPSGCITKKYWNSISDPAWMDSLSSSPHKQDSFLRFVMKKLQPTLEPMFDYLLIDARAGITYYGTIGQYIATRQAMIFCPNDEAKDALETVLLPALEESQKNRKEAYDIDKECGIKQTGFPLERVVFIVSRLPPELNERHDKVFGKMKELIKDKTEKLSAYDTYTKVLPLSSDLDIHLEPRCRTIDERYFDENADIVQIHKDILKIFAAICPEFPEKCPDYEHDSDSDREDNSPLYTKAKAVWRSIFNKEFMITRENRLFGFLSSGIMNNPDDNERNIAFKVDTFLGFLNNFYDTLSTELNFNENEDRIKKCKDMMDEALLKAGKQCGEAFGDALLKQWKKKGKNYNQAEKIRRWCGFDTRAGFGKMEYNEETEKLEVKNLFILKPEVTGKNREYTAFFNGYVIGVLSELTEQTVSLSHTSINETEKSITYEIKIGANT